mgnify:CR=1 FL=1
MNPTTTILDVNVVDTRNGTVTAHQDVVLANEQIVSIITSRPSVVGTARGRSVEGRGRFLVPGYVDMHAHPLNGARPDTDALALMLAHGITGFRQMAGSPQLLRSRREGTLDLGPRSPRLLALPGSLLTPLNAGTSEAAVAEVARQAADGADFIKVALVTPDVYFAAQAEGDRHAIRLLGHLPAGIDVRAASRAGFRSIEHVGPGLGVIAGCSHQEHQVLASVPSSAVKIPSLPTIPLLSRLVDKVVGRMMKKLVLNPAMVTKPDELAAMRHAIDTFEEDKARELARELLANDTWSCPTLIRVQAQQLCDNPRFGDDEDLRYLHPHLRRTWAGAALAFHDTFDPEQREVFAAQFDLQRRIVGLFHHEGVPMLAGTDAVGAVWVVAGSSLHRELGLLASAGLSPLSVLQSTTLNPARFLGREARGGSVEVGREADLVLLEADPLEDVANLASICAVVRDGTTYDASDLAAIKDDVARRGLR